MHREDFRLDLLEVNVEKILNHLTLSLSFVHSSLHVSRQTTTTHVDMIPAKHQSQSPKPTMRPPPKDVEIYLIQLGLLANLTMAIGKGIAGYLCHSQALLTDGLHSLTDLVADLIALATVFWPSSTTTLIRLRGPWSGNKDIESLGALVLSSLLLFGGVAMGLTSLGALYTLTFTSRSHQERPGVPDLKAAIVAAASVLVKEWLYQTSTYMTPYQHIH